MTRAKNADLDQRTVPTGHLFDLLDGMPFEMNQIDQQSIFGAEFGQQLLTKSLDATSSAGSGKSPAVEGRPAGRVLHPRSIGPAQFRPDFSPPEADSSKCCRDARYPMLERTLPEN